ncbi:MAG: peptidoglycan DD-metalloendopeptidase family protein [Candidatus Paceibacterota bacterium]|jgi:murein DD-endopeptidase MepM/ murein hydrolase activator NlpD
MTGLFKKGSVVLLVFICGIFWTNFSFAATQQELQDSINKKNAELQQVSSQILETQKQLEATQQTGTTLKKAVTNIDKQISQLNLNIQSSQITIQKLNLEIDSLQYDIADTRTKVDSKKAAIDEILRQMQQTSEDTPLTVFLRGEQLTDGFFEFQNLKDLNKNLADNVSQLNVFEDQLNGALQEATDKNQQTKSENQTLKNKKSITQDLKQEKQILLQQTKSQEKTYQSQLSELQKQQNAIADEITKLEQALASGFNTNVLPTKRVGVLSWPIKMTQDGGTGRLTQSYGAASRLYKSGVHNGIDIGTPIGTPVYAADDGVVTTVGNNDKSSYARYQYGRYILIKHNNNFETIYAHLSRQVVQSGASVKRGDIIGYSGNTGFSTGPHLHFGVYWAPSILMKSIPPANGLVPIGVTVNPADYL